MAISASRLNRRGFLAGSAAFGTLIGLQAYAALALAGQSHLRVLETTDLHLEGHFLHFGSAPDL